MTTPPAISRRTALATGPIALAAACALPACSAAPRPAATLRAPPPDNRLRNLRDAPFVIVAGERLDADLLRRFYERHDYQLGVVGPAPTRPTP